MQIKVIKSTSLYEVVELFTHHLRVKSEVLALSLTHSFIFSQFLGSGPNRAQSPIEWEEIQYIHPSIHMSVHMSIHMSVHPKPPGRT